jgi:REP-associated tyrosine transposase
VARLPRSLLPDGGFHVATRCVAKTAIYRDDDDRLVFLGLLAQTVDHFEWTCHSYCLMTNHYHLVIDATRANLSDGLQMLNGVYAQGFNGRHERWGHVFGDRFWCRTVPEEELETVCLYVLNNPVRAGLCERITDWPWSACRFELG